MAAATSARAKSRLRAVQPSSVLTAPPARDELMPLRLPYIFDITDSVQG